MLLFYHSFKCLNITVEWENLMLSHSFNDIL